MKNDYTGSDDLGNSLALQSMILVRKVPNEYELKYLTNKLK